MQPITRQIYESTGTTRAQIDPSPGAVGYAGSTTVRRLLSHGLEVAAMVREASAAGEAVVTSGHIAWRGR